MEKTPRELGHKSLVGNNGYRKFFDASEVAIKNTQLWMVEDIFRSMKSLLDTRPIFISATKR